MESLSYVPIEFEPPGSEHKTDDYLANAITDRRPNYAAAQAKMKQVCSQCHTPGLIDHVYSQAEQVVQSTNQHVRSAQDIVSGLRKDGVL